MSDCYFHYSFLQISSISEPAKSPTPSTTPQISQSQLSAESKDTAQVITPWDVQGAVVDGKNVAVDYDKLIVQFGTRAIDNALLERFEKLTNRKPHLYLRRGMFFSHRLIARFVLILSLIITSENSTVFSIVMNKESLSTFTQVEVQVATVCIWDI